MDYIPQRDGSMGSSKPLHMTPQQESQARALVSKLLRPDLEDKYLRSQEENIMLKRHVRKQEDKIKKISTKLIRLVNDRKKWSAETGQSGKRTTREVSLEETIETQQDTIRKLEKDNELLRQKLHVASQQLLTQGRRHTPYGHIQSRVNSGIEKRPVSARDRHRQATRSKSPGQDSLSTSVGPKYGHSLLEEAREENQKMQGVIQGLQEQLANMEREHDILQNELRLKHAAHEDDVLKFKEEMNSTKKTAFSENVELIRLKRENKEKGMAYQSMEARYRELQDMHQNVRVNYDKVLQEMDTLKSKLIQEEKRSLSLQNQIKHGSRSDSKSAEFKQTIYDLEKEVEILKEANERLTRNAFAAEQEQKWRRVEHELRKQIAQLESVVQYDLKDKDSVLHRAASERAIKDRMHEETKRLHEECTRLRTDNEDLRNRMRLVSSLDDAVDASELEEALSVIRQKRHLASERKRPGFLEDVDDNKDLETLYNELQVQLAETAQELDKTREMLLMQHRINKDYQIEVDSVSNKMEEMKREYESKLEHYAQLLDARAARVKKLERQLHDVAYGTKQFKLKPEDEEEMEAEDDMFDVARLERGENLLEINISKVTLSKDALQAMEDREPSTFITFAFYDYELVSTPIMKSGSPRFDFTSQYIIKVDDLFLHHLQKGNTLIELHQAFGTDYQTICACKIRLNQLLDKPQGKLHGSTILTGVGDGNNYGTLDFWVRLRVPMDQAIRLYKERTKALGYLSANSAATQKQLDTSLTLQQQDENFNQLELSIMSCNHVQARRQGVQPNIYCVYKFFDFADHDTVIIPNSNNPHFDDLQHFPVQMSSDLDAYLKSEKLCVYVFDDSDPEEATYLGKASINLIPLAHNKVIRAPFQLYSPEGAENGTVELSLRWKLPYKAPANVMRIPVSDAERQEKNQKLQEDQMIPEKLVTHIVKPKEQKPPVQKPRKAVKKLSLPKASVSEPVEDTAPKQILTPESTKMEETASEISASDEVVAEVTTPKTVEEKTTEPKESDAEISEFDSENLDEPVVIHQLDEQTEPAPLVDEKSETKPESSKPKPKARKVKQAGSLDDTTETLPRKEHLDIPEIPGVTVVKEKRPETPEAPGSVQDIEEEIEEEITEPAESEDSDSVVVSGATQPQEVADSIRITVNHLTLHPESWAYKDADIQKLFVEYTFLGSVEETPISLPKPKNPAQEMNYNFSKVTHVDAQNNEDKRSHLAAMILPTAEVESTITFTVVSEPANQDEDCDEIGFAVADMKDIVEKGQDLVEIDLEVMDGSDSTGRHSIGRLNVSVEAISALNSVHNEVSYLLEQSIGK